jgi:hypothetical protein
LFSKESCPVSTGLFHYLNILQFITFVILNRYNYYCNHHVQIHSRYIQDIFKTTNYTDLTILNLYIPIIYHDNSEAYITKTEKVKAKYKTSNPNTYTYTEDINEAATFISKENAQTLSELKGLDFTIVQFKDLFTKAYTIAISNDKTSAEPKLIIHTSWKPINYQQSEHNIFTTTNISLAKEKLSDFKYNLIKSLQIKIATIATLQIN